MQTAVGSLTLAIEYCYQCGIPFGLSLDFRNRRLEDHSNFYCPAGHPQYFCGKSEADKLRDELAREQRRATCFIEQRDNLARQNSTLTRQNAAQRGVATRIKNRISAGVCPCCNRTFAQLAKHMASQHPDWAHKDQQAKP